MITYEKIKEEALKCGEDIQNCKFDGFVDMFEEFCAKNIFGINDALEISKFVNAILCDEFNLQKNFNLCEKDCFKSLVVKLVEFVNRVDIKNSKEKLCEIQKTLSVIYENLYPFFNQKNFCFLFSNKELCLSNFLESKHNKVKIISPLVNIPLLYARCLIECKDYEKCLQVCDEIMHFSLLDIQGMLIAFDCMKAMNNFDKFEYYFDNIKQYIFSKDVVFVVLCCFLEYYYLCKKDYAICVQLMFLIDLINVNKIYNYDIDYIKTGLKKEYNVAHIYNLENVITNLNDKKIPCAIEKINVILLINAYKLSLINPKFSQSSMLLENILLSINANNAVTLIKDEVENGVINVPIESLGIILRLNEKFKIAKMNVPNKNQTFLEGFDEDNNYVEFVFVEAMNANNNFKELVDLDCLKEGNLITNKITNFEGNEVYFSDFLKNKEKFCCAHFNWCSKYVIKITAKYVENYNKIQKCLLKLTTSVKTLH